MKYIISAGGTGGHIYPALELARALEEKGHEVIFYAASKPIDKDIISKQTLNFKVKYIKMSGLQRKLTLTNIIKNFINIFYVFYAFTYFLITLLVNRPTYVIGFGGYVTFPLLYVASILKINTAIHEQNSYPGLVNRKLAPRVTKVFYTFESSLKYLKPKGKAIYTSNPRIDVVRSKIAEGVHCNYDVEKKILFIGGSLGAEKINDIAIEYAKNNSNYKVIIVTGERYFEKYSHLEVTDNVFFIKYLSDPIESFLCSEVVISRGGASTIVELMSSKTLSIFIPSPNVVDDHQTVNVKEFVDKDMAKAISESELSASKLQSEIDDIILNKQAYLQNMNEYGDFKSIETIEQEING